MRGALGCVALPCMNKKCSPRATRAASAHGLRLRLAFLLLLGRSVDPNPNVTWNRPLSEPEKSNILRDYFKIMKYNDASYA